MDKETILLMVIDDLRNKLADAEHRESDYKAQCHWYAQRIQELEEKQVEEDEDVT